jgi:hypothetical protein
MAPMTRRLRLFTAIAAAAVLLFSQLALSAHFCAMAMPSPAMAQGECDEVMPDANLCRTHCDYGSASFDAAKPVHASPVAIPASLKVSLPDISVCPIAAPSPHVPPGPAPPPPLARFTVLRI